TQAAIIASAIAQTIKNSLDQSSINSQPGENGIVIPQGLSNSELSFRIDPEIVSPMLRDLVGPTKTRARVFDTDGTLISDSRSLYHHSQSGRLGGVADGEGDILSDIWTYLKVELLGPALPVYKDMGPDGKAYEELRVALTGSPSPLIRLTEAGERVISIA